MLSLFKRKEVVNTEATFKTRVQQFWKWYAEAGPRFHQVIEAGKCPTLANEVSAKVDELIPGFAWVFGPGENGQGHSFTLSGEGNLHRQLLTIFWLANAPKLSGWTFYSSRQPGSVRGQRIEIGDRTFDPLEFWITPVVNLQDEKLDITVWHPLFDKLAEKDRWTILFLFLDEVLGEYGTQQYIREIKHDPKRLADSIPLEELNEFIKRIQSENGWKKLPPGENAVLYQFGEPHARFLRGDIITGWTANTLLLNEYLEALGQPEDLMKSTGADYVFVAFEAKILPKGNEAGARGQIEDALDRALKSSNSGRLLGGAWGRQNAYIDLLLFDGAASIEIVKQVMRDKALPPGSSINYFAKEKRGHRVLI
ncbi:MAG TPA: hypothetical protein VMH87_17450 [Pseudomonadales bacterium]|nr:hypothetical protein [Pseudomonadales bacterium]